MEFPNAMQICVKLYGTLSDDHAHADAGQPFDVDLPQQAVVRDLIRFLHISPKRIGIVTVNGKLAKSNQKLRHNDQVQMFQPIAGG